MAGLPLDTWIRFAGWLIVAILLYGFYGMRHSRVGGQDLAASRP